ncbi:TetR/AcrR family transcriptional regulator [Thalassobacillus devorans]|uniref:TetR/AcrR family transcriptional regulator n=1 Tax=Thalassobacillus devorans TaxID=279813 RepID=UPI000A1C7C3D|nr:TetR/AcrR family transcriptional regulator [Thalassobacillus devorans]
MSPKVSKEHLQQRRADILEAAKRVFIQYGYEAATMKHVMEEAGVSRGGLYQYFSNKEDLYETILKENLSEVSDKTKRSLDEKTASYWDLLLLRVFGEDKQPNDEMDPLAPSNLEFFITGRNDERRRKYGQQRYRKGLKVYADVIEAGQKSGEFSSQYDSKVLARTIISFIDGLALDHAILPEEDVQLKDQSTMLLEYLKMTLNVE